MEEPLIPRPQEFTVTENIQEVIFDMLLQVTELIHLIVDFIHSVNRFFIILYYVLREANGIRKGLDLSSISC